MSDKRLVLEIDEVVRGNGMSRTIRVNISVLDKEDRGHGYRLCGPKFVDAVGSPLKTVTLDQWDREAIRNMLNEIDGDAS